MLLVVFQNSIERASIFSRKLKMENHIDIKYILITQNKIKQLLEFRNKIERFTWNEQNEVDRMEGHKAMKLF